MSWRWPWKDCVGVILAFRAYNAKNDAIEALFDTCNNDVERVEALHFWLQTPQEERRKWERKYRKD